MKNFIRTDPTKRLPCVACAAMFAAWMVAPSAAQSPLEIDPVRGAILIHGNYCGPGNRSPLPPVDALDLACLRHDSCSPPRGQTPSCACNRQLHVEAGVVAEDPDVSESVRDTAGFISDTAQLLPCR